MSSFKPNPQGIHAFQQRAKQALAEAISDVGNAHQGHDPATIRQALIAGAKARGFADFKPADELVERIRNGTL